MGKWVSNIEQESVSVILQMKKKNLYWYYWDSFQMFNNLPEIEKYTSTLRR